MFRRLLSLALTSALALPALAVNAVVVQHQGRLVTAEDVLVEGPQTLLFQLWKAPTKESTDGDVVVWHSSVDVNVTKGTYAVALGEKDAFPADAFSAPRWLSVTIGASELLPRLRIGSTPSALRADVADLAKGLDCVACVKDASIVGVAGAKVVGEVARATVAATAEALSGGILGSAVQGKVAAAEQADSATKLGTKAEADLSVASAVTAASAAKLGTKAEGELSVLNAAKLDGKTPAELVSGGVFAASNHTHTAANSVEWTALKGVPTNLGGPPAGTVVFSKTATSQPLVDAGYKKSDLAPVITGGAWYGKKALTRDTRCAVVVAANGKIWSIGGYADDAQSLAVTQSYDPALDTWDQRLPMPVRKHCFNGTVIGNKIYVMGGEAQSGSNTDRRANFVYDTTNNTWTPFAALTGASNHYDGFAAPILNGTKIVLVGGYNQITTPNYEASVDEYDLALDGWVTRPAGPMAHHHGGAAQGADGRIYQFAGYGTNATVTQGQSLDIYDPVARTWSKGASFPVAAYGLGAVAVGNLIVVTGGAFADGSPNLITYVYDISLNAWSTLAPMPNKRWHHKAALLNGLIYAVGGYIAGGSSGNTALVDALGAPQALYPFEKL